MPRVIPIRRRVNVSSQLNVPNDLHRVSNVLTTHRVVGHVLEKTWRATNRREGDVAVRALADPVISGSGRINRETKVANVGANRYKVGDVCRGTE
jgi:hypothetical protein